MACRCLASLALIEAKSPGLPYLTSAPVMSAVVLRVVPMMSIADDDIKRQGATEAIALLLDKMQLCLVPYILFLVVPLLGECELQPIQASPYRRAGCNRMQAILIPSFRDESIIIF